MLQKHVHVHVDAHTREHTDERLLSGQLDLIKWPRARATAQSLAMHAQVLRVAVETGRPKR